MILLWVLCWIIFFHPDLNAGDSYKTRFPLTDLSIYTPDTHNHKGTDDDQIWISSPILPLAT